MSLQATKDLRVGPRLVGTTDSRGEANTLRVGGRRDDLASTCAPMAVRGLGLLGVVTHSLGVLRAGDIQEDPDRPYILKTHVDLCKRAGHDPICHGHLDEMAGRW